MKKIILLILFFANIASGQNEVTAEATTTLGMDSISISGFSVIDYTLPNYDTIMVIMLVCDTAHHFEEIDSTLTCEFVKCTDTMNFHAHFMKIKKDRGNNGSGLSYWIYGYSVREKRNTIMDSIDPYEVNGFVSRYYHVHKFYLDIEKQQLSPNIIVWNSIPLPMGESTKGQILTH
ncbi:MAG: hypothetical protein IPO16_14965 [Saprospiraceae bacterium]|nr:hypothetical protein [Saprospiraceae bacterium]